MLFHSVAILHSPFFDLAALFSINFFDNNTNPKICVHSETIFPTTCPHLDSESILAKKITQPIPVIARNIVNEWSRRNSHRGFSIVFGSGALSADPFSYKRWLASTVTTIPSQSAIAFPKKDPTCVCSFDTRYITIHKINIPLDTRLSECSLTNDFFFFSDTVVFLPEFLAQA
jgi:hypothetical protein